MLASSGLKNAFENQQNQEMEPMPEQLIRCVYMAFNLGIYRDSQNRESRLTGTIYLPLERTKNPHTDEANILSLNWLIRLGFIKEGSPSCTAIKESNFAALFSTPLRLKGLDDLLLKTKFIIFLFLFDDVIDKTNNKSDLQPDKLNTVFSTFEHILTGKLVEPDSIPPSDFPYYEKFCAALFDIRRSMNTYKSARSDYFQTNLKRYFGSIFTEIALRSSSVPLSEETYRMMREETGAVRLTFSFIDFILGIDVEKDIKDDLIKRRIENAAVYALSLANDLFSFAKEKAKEKDGPNDEPDHENLIGVKLNEFANSKKKQEGPPLQAAIDYTIECHNREMTDFFTLPQTIRPGAGQNTGKPLTDFEIHIRMMEDCLFDNAIWSGTLTTRYQLRKPLFICHYTVGVLPKQDTGTVYEGAERLTFPSVAAIGDERIVSGIVHHIIGCFKEGNENKNSERLTNSLHSLAMLTRAGVITPDNLGNIVKALVKKDLENRQIAIKFTDVMNDKAIVDLSDQLLPGELLDAIGSNQPLLVKPGDMNTRVDSILNIFREDSFGQSLLYALYQNKKNVEFTDEFMKQLLGPMIHSVMEDFALIVNSHDDSAKWKKAAKEGPWSLDPSRSFDYSERTAGIIKETINGLYFKALEGFSHNLSLVPEPMKMGASAIYKSLDEISPALSNLFDIEHTMNVDMGVNEFASDPKTRGEIKVRSFLVYLVGLYLNLRLLRQSFWSFFEPLFSMNDEGILSLLESTFFSSKRNVRILREELARLDDSKTLFGDKKFVDFHKKIHKINETKDDTELKNKIIALVKEKSLASVLNVYRSAMLAGFPVFSRYMFLLLNYKKVMSAEHKTMLKTEVRGLNFFLEDAVVEWCRVGLKSLVTQASQKKLPENESGTSSDLAVFTEEKPNKRRLLAELRASVNKEFGQNITILYAKLSIVNNISNKEEKKQGTIKIYENRKASFNTSPHPDTDYRFSINDRSFNELLTLTCQENIATISKQLLLGNDPARLSAGLNNMVRYISIIIPNPAISSKFDQLCSEVISWLEKELIERNDSGIHYDILACLTFYGVVFDDMRNTLSARIHDVCSRVNPENYKRALKKYDKTTGQLKAGLDAQLTDLSQINHAREEHHTSLSTRLHLHLPHRTPHQPDVLPGSPQKNKGLSPGFFAKSAVETTGHRGVERQGSLERQGGEQQRQRQNSLADEGSDDGSTPTHHRPQ